MAKHIFYRNYNKFANSQKKELTKNNKPTKRNSKNKIRTILLKKQKLKKNNLALLGYLTLRRNIT